MSAVAQRFRCCHSELDVQRRHLLVDEHGAPRASLRALLIEARAILNEVDFHDSRTAVERRNEAKVDARSDHRSSGHEGGSSTCG
jgi:hypothetical protein